MCLYIEHHYHIIIPLKVRLSSALHSEISVLWLNKQAGGQKVGRAGDRTVSSPTMGDSIVSFIVIGLRWWVHDTVNAFWKWYFQMIFCLLNVFIMNQIWLKFICVGTVNSSSLLGYVNGHYLIKYIPSPKTPNDVSKQRFHRNGHEQHGM